MFDTYRDADQKQMLQDIGATPPAAAATPAVATPADGGMSVPEQAQTLNAMSYGDPTQSMAPATQAAPDVPPPVPVDPANQDRAMYQGLLRAGIQDALTSRPGVFVPGGDVVTGYQTQQGPQARPEDIAAQEEALGKQETAGQLQSYEQTQAARAEAERKQQEANAAAARAREEEGRSNQINGEIERRMAKADAVRQQAADAVVQTPSEFWQSKGSGAQALAMLAVFFDGVASGLTGKESTLAKQLNEQVNTELAAQERRKKALGDQATALAGAADQYAAMFGTPQAQLSAKKAVALEATLKQFDAMATKSNLPLTDATIAAQRAQLTSQLAAERAKLYRDQGEAVTTAHQVVQPHYAGGKAPDIAKAAKLAKELADSGGGGTLEEGAARANANRVIVDGSQYFAKDASQAGELQNYFLANSKVQMLGKQILDNIDKYQSLPTQEQGVLKAQTTQLMLTLKDVYQLGVLSDSDRDILDQLTGGRAVNLFTRDSTTRKQLANVLQNAAKERRDKMQILSTKPGEYVPATGGLRLQAPVQ